MSHSVALSFEDGVTRFVSCSDGQTVADAAYRSRINIPLDCRDGACGTCKALCESGDFDAGTYLEDALSVGESEQGYCLPCSMTPKSDLVLQIASTSAVAKTRAATHESVVTAVDRLSPTTVRLAVEAPQVGEPTFLPGQYVNITVPGSEQTRSYSFSCVSGSDELEFLVKLTPGGSMSTYLADVAAVGDKISFTGPHGSFFLREAQRPALLLAGGTGLAPILSILRTLAAESSSRPVHLVYGASTDEDVVLLDELTELASQLDMFTWDHCVSDPTSTAANKGYVTSLLSEEHLHGGDVAVYLCGPPPMVEAVRSHFAESGIEPTGFYYEKFAPSAPAINRPAPRSEPETMVAETVIAEPVTAQVAVPAEPELLSGDESTSDARSLCGRTVYDTRAEKSLHAVNAASARDEANAMSAIAGQRIWPAHGVEPLIDHVEPISNAVDYEIGEEHPSVYESDAVFEARRALELGALELVIGRLTSQQIAGYRLLADATTRYVDGDRFVDAGAYTETNAAFHDYLFIQTRNEHLLQAYRALGVEAAMEDVLRNATWCDPLCAQDHLDIVDAFEAGDRDRARTLIADHADRSKTTMKRAMHDSAVNKRPKFVSPGRFTGKVVLITGAAQGIGESVARRIAAEGGALMLADRSELVEELSEELTRDGSESGSVLADLETWAGASAAVDAALATHGRVDISIHVVGGTIWAKPFAEYAPEQVEKEISRSLFPTLWSCRAVIPHMISQGAGTIVNVSSVATRGVHRVPYAAAKGGVNAITSALALEAAPHGVRVVPTAPGGTEAPPRRVARGPAPSTDQEQQWYQAIVDQTVDSSLLKRYGTLDEQAAAICFLASDEASYITGTVLPVAGGDPG
ncbi:oxidoreductase [Rhodococcus sp. EPR-157]|nr:benzoate 1,2-dioxygenase electron transfer component BenC [Rhodococcus sp. EPR-157]KZF12317.1 oxidoreductase [Rhodococcus sp. EPR-157]